MLILFRVTTVSSHKSAAAVIRLSNRFAQRGMQRRPQMSAASFLERQNRVSVDRRNASQAAIERARRAPSPRSGMRSVPRRGSPAVITERYKRVLPRAFHGGLSGLPLAE
jgi:hypothetical protein